MFWLLLLLAAASAAEEICLSVQEDPYLYFATKTAYIFANKDVPSTRAHEVPGCQPIAFWLLNRHGSTNPEHDEVPDLQKLLDLKQTIISNYRNGNYRNTNHRICTADVDLLSRWEWNPRHNLTFAGELTTDGYMTTQQLAQAWKQKFSAVMSANPNNYLFEFANDQRSKITFKAFSEGLFGDQAESLGLARENEEAKVMPYKSCATWIKEVGDKNETMEQRRIFESKMEFREMITNVSLRLGYNYDLPVENIHRIYQMCRYEKAWDVVKISPWCSVFTREDLKRLEYAEDLEMYYKYGYGSPQNKEVGCSMVKDFMEFFHRHVSSDEPAAPHAKIYLTDAGALLTALTAMGAHSDVTPLTGDNYHSALVQARRWTTSTMMPYNANLAVALYKCTQNGNFQVNEPYQVLFLENERPMNIEGCRVGLCDWSLVKNKFDELAKNCNLNFCSSAIKINSITAISIAAFAMVFRYFVGI